MLSVKPPQAFCKCFYLLIQVDPCPAGAFCTVCAGESDSIWPVPALSHIRMFLGFTRNVSLPAMPKSTGSLMRKTVKCHTCVRVYLHSCDMGTNMYARVLIYI